MADETSLVRIPPEQVERAQTLNALTITSPDDERIGIDGLTFVQAVLKGNEKTRKGLVAPHNDTVKKINESFKRLNEPFEAAEKHLKSLLLDWRNAETARIQEEQNRIARENAAREKAAQEEADRIRKEAEEAARAEAEAAGLNEEETQQWTAEVVKETVAAVAVEVERMPVAPPTTVRSVMGGATLRTTWEFEITDESLVPIAYRMVDIAAIRVAVRAGIREIPGVHIFEKQSIAGSRNR